MSEDGNSSPVKNSVATPEMSPQSDGTKLPLTNNDGVKVEEAKFKKGDTEIDIGIPKAFSGLTKEELMKYSTDPFWIRLRIVLFATFWLAWLAMLVLAIVIIIKAPACKPPPERAWVEEEAIVNIDPNDISDPQGLVAKMDTLGIFSAYYPALVTNPDFKPALSEELKTFFAAIVSGNVTRHIVTDFPPIITMKNPLYDNASTKGLIDENGYWNYTNEALPSAMVDLFMNDWIKEGIKGFLMPEVASENVEDIKIFKDEINALLKEQDASFGCNMVDFAKIQTDFSVNKFEKFLEDNDDFWAYYKYDAVVPSIGNMDQFYQRLTTIGLFLYGGTPMLINYEKVIEEDSISLINKLSEMRSLQGIKLGQVNMVNTTSDKVVAFTRIYKGTPAYAVALNFNNLNETVSFVGTPNVKDEGTVGTVEIDSQEDKQLFDTKAKMDLTEITLKPLQGLVIQFVGDF